MKTISHRHFLSGIAGASALVAAGCSSTPTNSSHQAHASKKKTTDKKGSQIMIVDRFLSSLFNSAEYNHIRYDTLYVLHILPAVVDIGFRVRRGFALASVANRHVPSQSIESPFCDCSFSSLDSKLVWRKELPKYSATRDSSIISLTQKVLKDKYQEALGFDDFSEKMDLLDDKVEYIELIRITENKMTSGSRVSSQAEKSHLLKILFFFNGVPSPLVNYYNADVLG